MKNIHTLLVCFLFFSHCYSCFDFLADEERLAEEVFPFFPLLSSPEATEERPRLVERGRAAVAAADGDFAPFFDDDVDGDFPRGVAVSLFLGRPGDRPRCCSGTRPACFRTLVSSAGAAEVFRTAVVTRALFGSLEDVLVDTATF